MAINIMEAARIAANNGEFKKAGVLMTFAKQSPLLQAIPTIDVDGNSYAWTRQAVLPGAAFRSLNSAYTESAGSTTRLTEALKAVGGDIDVDNYIVQTGGAQARTTHEEMKSTAIAQALGYAIVKGSLTAVGGATADPNGLDGLQARYGQGFSTSAVVDSGANASQIIANNGAGDALSLAKLDEVILATDNTTHLLMAKKMRINITSKMRNSASLATTRDEFGRLVQTYNGIPILDADVNGDTAALGFNENNDSTTSIYALSLSPSGLHLIQAGGGMDVRDLGEQDSKPVWRTRIEWYVGLVDEHPRCVARLYNIADAVAVD